MNTKTTPKSCSCKACKRSKATPGGHFYRKSDERAYRHASKIALLKGAEVIGGAPPDGVTPEYLAWVEFITGRTWPDVITGPGEYRTRNGKRVVIDQYSRSTISSWPHAGHIIHRVKPEKIEWNTWKSNGQFGALGEHCLDIVGRWK